LADFGRSCLKGSDFCNTGAWGIMPYVDPKFFEIHSYRITEKSDIYSLGVLFWELTSRKSPFDFEKRTKSDHSSIKMKIRDGVREEPVKNTNDKFVILYKSKYKKIKKIEFSSTIFTIIFYFILLECWQHEPDNRPNIHEVNSELNLINTENNNVSITFTPKESEENGKTENLYLSD
jgi:hypothetical protein